MINNSVTQMFAFLLLILLGTIINASLYFFIKLLAKKIIKVDASTWAQTKLSPFSKNNRYKILLTFLLNCGLTIVMVFAITLLGSAFLFFLICVCVLCLFPGGKYIGISRNPRTLKGWLIGNLVASCTFFISGLIMFLTYQLYSKII